MNRLTPLPSLITAHLTIFTPFPALTYVNTPPTGNAVCFRTLSHRKLLLRSRTRSRFRAAGSESKSLSSDMTHSSQVTPAVRNLSKKEKNREVNTESQAAVWQRPSVDTVQAAQKLNQHADDGVLQTSSVTPVRQRSPSVGTPRRPNKKQHL